jgi:hypothetical protein
MKNYKALVTNNRTGAIEIIEMEYSSKANFIKDIRLNGLKVDPMKVKEADIFDFIMNNTNCNKCDWNQTSNEVDWYIANR